MGCGCVCVGVDGVWMMCGGEGGVGWCGGGVR